MEIMLKIENVYKNYKKLEVLKGVTFSVKQNEIKGFVGINGAGKSTLIEIICGVKKLDKGDIFISDINIAERKRNKEIKALIGYMPQSFALFNDLTVKENLGYLCAVYGLDEKVRISEVIKTCNLVGKENVLASNLSGGYRQLLSLAGAIIHQPKILILDEPSSAMDPLFRKEFWKIIKKYRKNGATVLLITHHMEELNECDSFALLKEGKIAIDKSVKEYAKNGLINIDKLLNKKEAKWTT